MNTKIRVIVADDHPVAREGICAWLRRDERVEVVATANDAATLAEAVSDVPCDFVFSDIGMQGVNGENNSIAFLRRLVRQTPRPYVVAVTMISHAQMLAGLMRLGVDGVIDKRDTLHSLGEAITAILAGEQFVSPHACTLIAEQSSWGPARAGTLSSREWEVFQLYASGLSMADIARRFGRSGKTIATQRRSAMRKLGLESEFELIAYLRHVGLA